MRAVLVDDEYYALEGLRMKLMDLGEVEVVGMYDNSQQFLQEIEDLHADVIFLDVEMPNKDGFGVLEELLERGLSPNVIFVTAFSQYAVQAFEINAMDYIVKPVSKERLQKTLDRVKLQLKKDPTKETGSVLQINCFHTFSLLYDGKVLNTGWRTKKSEELLAYLICEKGQFVSKEILAEALWPEVDGEKSMQNLHVAYYYLKQQEKKMGIKLPIDSKRGRMRLLLEDIQIDMKDFDELCAQSEDSTKKEDDQISYLEKAVSLYKGGLLQDRYYSWVLDLQQHYEMKYEEILQKLIRYFDHSTSIKKQIYYKECLLRHTGEHDIVN